MLLYNARVHDMHAHGRTRVYMYTSYTRLAAQVVKPPSELKALVKQARSKLEAKHEASSVARPGQSSTLRFSTARIQSDATAPLWDFGEEAGPLSNSGSAVGALPGGNGLPADAQARVSSGSTGTVRTAGSSATLKGHTFSESFQVRADVPSFAEL